MAMPGTHIFTVAPHPSTFFHYSGDSKICLNLIGNHWVILMTEEKTYPPVERMLRRKEVEQITGRSRSSIYADIENGTFPKPVKIGARAIAWPESVIREWIAERVVAAQRPPHGSAKHQTAESH